MQRKFSGRTHLASNSQNSYNNLLKQLSRVHVVSRLWKKALQRVRALLTYAILAHDRPTEFTCFLRSFPTIRSASPVPHRGVTPVRAWSVLTLTANYVYFCNQLTFNYYNHRLGKVGKVVFLTLELAQMSVHVIVMPLMQALTEPNRLFIEIENVRQLFCLWCTRKRKQLRIT
jgi:hypothetical protein